MRLIGLAASVVSALLTGHAMAQGGPSTIVYRCPGNVYTSDRELTPAQAKERDCKAIESAPVTVVQTSRPRAAAPAAASAPRPPASRVDPEAQRERDSDARSILNDELRREEARLADLQREYNNGQPERLGSERNYQRYLDRVAEMKAGIARKEADIAAIKRELSKLPS